MSKPLNLDGVHFVSLSLPSKGIPEDSSGSIFHNMPQKASQSECLCLDAVLSEFTLLLILLSTSSEGWHLRISSPSYRSLPRPDCGIASSMIMDLLNMFDKLLAFCSDFDSHESLPICCRPPIAFPECGSGNGSAAAPAQPNIVQNIVFPPIGAFSLGW